MGGLEGSTCRYEIDAADRLRHVAGAWLDFARDNDAPQLTRDAVIGRPLWEFIAGAETRELYRPILERVRRQDVSVIVPFRCDSPGFRRWMRLVIQPGRDGGVCFDGVLVRKLERVHLGILDPHTPRAPRELPMCSGCKRVEVESQWLEPEDAIARLHLLGAEPYPTLRHVVCEDCRDEIGRAAGEHA